MNRITMLITLAAFTAIGVGCEDNRKYFQDGVYRLPDQHDDVQAANGAREDGMLYPRHFAGDKLSSLGQTKLDLIARASEDGTDTVYVFLNIPEDAVNDAKKKNVEEFLAEKGVKTERVSLAVGPNPGTKNLATLTSGKLYKSADATKVDVPVDTDGYGKAK